MEHIVKGCKGCPLYNDEWGSCNHPNHENKNGNGDCSESWWNDTYPDFCPLKKEPITITLEQ